MNKNNVQMQKLIARCWADKAFKATLLADPVKTLRSVGVDVPSGVTIAVVEDTADSLHFVIPCLPDVVAAGASMTRDLSPSQVHILHTPGGGTEGCTVGGQNVNLAAPLTFGD